MQLNAGQTIDLIDSEERQVGQIVIERSEGDLVFGRFMPGPAFPAVQHLFREFEEAVDLQALSVVDELDATIAALGLHLRLPASSQRVEIRDVQIWSDGGITCRVDSPNMSTVERELESRQPNPGRGGKGPPNKPMISPRC